jgi:hypothetical protein
MNIKIKDKIIELTIHMPDLKQSWTLIFLSTYQRLGRNFVDKVMVAEKFL